MEKKMEKFIDLIFKIFGEDPCATILKSSNQLTTIARHLNAIGEALGEIYKENSEWVTAKEAAFIAKVSVRWLREIRKSGLIAFKKTVTMSFI